MLVAHLQLVMYQMDQPLTASMIGYSDVSMDASRTINFQLDPSAVGDVRS